MKRQQIFKREEAFARNLKSLDERWFQRDDFLMLKDTKYGFAEFWKYQTYFTQKDAASCLDTFLFK